MPQKRVLRGEYRARLKTTYELEGGSSGVNMDEYNCRHFSKTELAEARSMFEQLAGAGSSSYVTMPEFHRNMRKICPKASHESRELLRQFLDKDFDGRIEWSEFLASFGLVKETLAKLASLDEENATEEHIGSFSEEEMSMLRNVYDAMDTNKDGTLSLLEFRPTVQKQLGYSDAQMDAMIAMVDINGDSAISFEEFVVAQTYFTSPGKLKNLQDISPPAATHALTARQISEATAVFNSFDTNNDGVLSYHELGDRMSDLGFLDNEIEQIVTSMDVNHDGKISMESFMSTYLDFIPMEDISGGEDEQE